MENLSHSYSKRSYHHANGFTETASKSPYDGVFGGRTKFSAPTLSPRLEDYTEVFGGFHSSRPYCIPVLDLPMAGNGEVELPFDVRSSRFDYSEIFGGFKAVDFAVSYEDLLRQSSAGYDSSDEAWSPSPSELLSDESDPLACSERHQSLFSADNGIKQFSISNCMDNGRSNLNVPDEIPDVAHEIRDSWTSRNTEDRKKPIEATVDVGQSTDFGGRTKKFASGLMNHSFGVNGSDREPSEKCNEYGSVPTVNQLFTVTDINLRTKPSQLPPPSRPLPVLAIKSGNSDRPNSSLKGSAVYAFEPISGETSPPSFGAEVDTSSPTAALKDAIARAQAKCQRAKESMEKKKQGLQSCKRHSDNISTEDATNSMFDEPAHCKDERVTGKLEREDSQGEAFAEESERMRTEDDLVLDLSEGREHSNFYGKSSERKKCKDYGLSQEAHRIEGTIAWTEAVEFFEIETSLPGDTYESFKYSKHCMDAHDQKHLLGAVTGAFEQLETCKPFRHSKGDPEWEEDRKQVKMEKEVYEFGKQCGRSVKVSQNLFDLKLNAEVFQQLGLIGELNENGHKNVADLRESEQKTNKFMAKPKPNSTLEGVDDEESIKGTEASKINRKETKSDFKKEECKGRHKDTVGKITRNNIVENELKQERRNLQHEEIPEREEKEEERGALESNIKGNRLKESLWHEEIDKKSKQGNENKFNNFVMDLEQEKNKRDQDLVCKREDDDKEIQDMFKWDLTHKHFTVKNEEPQEQNVNREKEESKRDESEVRITKISKQAQEEERFSLASESESDNIFEVSDELEEIECMFEDGGKLEELDENTSYNEQITIDCENGEALDREYVSNDETVHVPQLHEKVEKSFKKLETTQASFSCDKNEVKITEGNNGELESEFGANNLLARERLNSVTEKQENMQYGKNRVAREVARKPSCLDAYFTNSKDVVNGVGSSSFKREKTASEMACRSENKQKIIHEGQNRMNVAALQFTIYKEVDNDKFAWHQIVRDVAENREKIGDALSIVLEDGEILSRIDQRSTNYCRERKETSSNECRNIEEQKVEILKKEKELEIEYLRKIEAEREREREREKDLMAVSLSNLEKSYAEANGRIELAASEMWQRGTADVKKLVKASTEVGLRAERAAVERATAEARQRAFEKAKAEKTAHDTREGVDTLSSHRFPSSDNTLMRQCSFSSDLLEHKNHGKSKLRYSYSSASAGIEGESPQRCRARLERYKRTAERAAKALAEKNMRDLLAQRELAERNRFAETLDAEVKRWSSGKEGNLRALLSTLQYILGPESGWHPIPLTEVITSAAVKKAFRKATLCVHPDKLQQRGASIQQKYICEKVFDLLKGIDLTIMLPLRTKHAASLTNITK